MERSSFTVGVGWARGLLTLATAAGQGVDAAVQWQLTARSDALIGTASPHIS